VPGQVETAPKQLHQCRQCCTFCDRVVLPAGCLEAGCRYLYFYDDEHTGRRYMGCLNKVFRAEIDVEVFEAAQRTRQGYGGVAISGDPLPVCRTTVEQAYWGTGAAFNCVNPEFFEPPAVDPDPAAFDLRDRL
jgi:hypothetical protein